MDLFAQIESPTVDQLATLAKRDDATGILAEYRLATLTNSPAPCDGKFRPVHISQSGKLQSIGAPLPKVFRPVHISQSGKLQRNTPDRVGSSGQCTYPNLVNSAFVVPRPVVSSGQCTYPNLVNFERSTTVRSTCSGQCTYPNLVNCSLFFCSMS